MTCLPVQLIRESVLAEQSTKPLLLVEQSQPMQAGSRGEPALPSEDADYLGDQTLFPEAFARTSP